MKMEKEKLPRKNGRYGHIWQSLKYSMYFFDKKLIVFFNTYETKNDGLLSSNIMFVITLEANPKYNMTNIFTSNNLKRIHEQSLIN